ncbi:MAG: hypothetical protein J7639_13070 [Paenibacillaceae bacterium]|nr:hypothetical protein [Paenibacillaceae bacterium]
MPNFIVYNVDPNQLQTLIFGSDGTNAVPLSVNSTGRLNIGDISTVTAVESATIAGGTIDALLAGTVNATALGGTIDALLAGTVNATILGGTVSATIAGGTIDALLAGTVNATALGGTIDALLAGTVSATILGGTVSATILAGTITTISQNNFNQFSLLGATFSSAVYTPIAAASLNQMTYPYRVYSYFVVNNAGAQTITARVELSSDGTNWVVEQTSTNLTSGAMVLTPMKFTKYTRLAIAVLAGSATVDVYLDAQV